MEWYLTQGLLQYELFAQKQESKASEETHKRMISFLTSKLEFLKENERNSEELRPATYAASVPVIT